MHTPAGGRRHPAFGYCCTSTWLEIKCRRRLHKVGVRGTRRRYHCAEVCLERYGDRGTARTRRPAMYNNFGVCHCVVAWSYLAYRIGHWVPIWHVPLCYSSTAQLTAEPTSHRGRTRKSTENASQESNARTPKSHSFHGSSSL
jgi:hypothetical protein